MCGRFRKFIRAEKRRLWAFNRLQHVCSCVTEHKWRSVCQLAISDIQTIRRFALLARDGPPEALDSTGSAPRVWRRTDPRVDTLTSHAWITRSARPESVRSRLEPHDENTRGRPSRRN